MMYVLLFHSCSFFFFLIALEIAILFPPLDSHSEFCNKIKLRYLKNQVVHILLCTLTYLDLLYFLTCVLEMLSPDLDGWIVDTESSRS